MKRLLVLLFVIMLAFFMLSACTTNQKNANAPEESNASVNQEAEAQQEQAAPVQQEEEKLDYPNRDIKAMIGYGAGGATDMALRPIFTIAEQILGESIVVENTPGASGATSWLSACESAPDGYTFCVGAETPCLYDAYDLIEYTYKDVIPIMVVSEAIQTITVAANSPYQTVKELFDAELNNPGTVLKVASGNVGVNATLSAIWKTVAGFDPGTYTSDGASSSIMTVLGGFADFCVSNTASVQSYLDSGDVRVLCTNSIERYWDDVPAIVEFYPEMEEYLPLGAFYTICVPIGTDSTIVTYLTDVFTQAFNTSEFQETCTSQGLIPVGATGNEAKAYIDAWRKQALSALTETGIVSYTMEELGY